MNKELLESLKETLEELEEMCGDECRPTGRSAVIHRAIEAISKADTKVRVRHWVQDTMESGRWELTEPMSEFIANRCMDEHCPWERPEIIK